MQCTIKISEDLIYLGYSDRRMSMFENLFPLPNGVSYNSYLLLDEKTVLFDTVDETVSSNFLENLTYALGNRELDYFVAHHMEPDHGAAITEILKRFPNAKIVCSSKAVTIFSQFFDMDISNRLMIVTDNDILSTGKHTLRFITAPMVHWPEVMVTYDEYDKILFSADAFGSFGALSGNIFDDELNFSEVRIKEARRYYTNIVGKFGVQVQSLIKKVSCLDIKMICSLHGPILRSKIGLMMDKYIKWSTYEPEEKSVIIVYGSMYHNTENLANVFAVMLAVAGVKNIEMYDVSKTHLSELIAESFRCSHIVLASPTYNNGIYPKMEAFLTDMEALGLRNRTIALLDNGSWAPVAGKKMEEKILGMKCITLLEQKVSVKSVLKDEQLTQLKEMAETIGQQLASS